MLQKLAHQPTQERVNPLILQNKLSYQRTIIPAGIPQWVPKNIRAVHDNQRSTFPRGPRDKSTTNASPREETLPQSPNLTQDQYTLKIPKQIARQWVPRIKESRTHIPPTTTGKYKKQLANNIRPMLPMWLQYPKSDLQMDYQTIKERALLLQRKLFGPSSIPTSTKRLWNRTEDSHPTRA